MDSAIAPRADCCAGWLFQQLPYLLRPRDSDVTISEFFSFADGYALLRNGLDIYSGRPTAEPAGDILNFSSVEMLRPSSLRVAAIQTESDFLDKDGNIARAKPLIEEAAREGAVLVLLPEMFAGYVYSCDLMWGAAETLSEGKISRFLCSEAKRLHIHLGASLLEANGEHFYNTFILAGDDPCISA